MRKLKQQSGRPGQTLIETLAALFILVMGVTAATGLAIYAFNSSTSIVKQIVGTGLAREGIEAVKNMRDTNWLGETVSYNNCYDFATSQADKANCYDNWLSEVYCIDPSNGGSCNGGLTTQNYFLGFDPSDPDFWNFDKVGTPVAQYGLDFNPTNSTGRGFYRQSSGVAGCSNTPGRSDYCRKIIITKNTSGVYDPVNSGGASQTPGPLLFVQSQVWWVDKKCPRVAAFNNAPISCRIELDTYLTNWKNY